MKNKTLKELREIREHFEALKEVDDSGKWDEYIAKLDEAEKLLKGE
ncbi:MAG: hypothetical protein ACI4Q5_03825 [Porcipelethomonas sp.]